MTPEGWPIAHKLTNIDLTLPGRYGSLAGRSAWQCITCKGIFYPDTSPPTSCPYCEEKERQMKQFLVIAQSSTFGKTISIVEASGSPDAARLALSDQHFGDIRKGGIEMEVHELKDGRTFHAKQDYDTLVVEVREGPL